MITGNSQKYLNKKSNGLSWYLMIHTQVRSKNICTNITFCLDVFYFYYKLFIPSKYYITVKMYKIKLFNTFWDILLDKIIISGFGGT